MVQPAKVEVREAVSCAGEGWIKEYQTLLPQQPVMAEDRKPTVCFLL